MKNIERIAVESILKMLDERMGPELVELTSLRTYFDEAKKNLQSAASKLNNASLNFSADIIPELSEDGIAYLEKEVSTKLGIPFKIK